MIKRSIDAVLLFCLHYLLGGMMLKIIHKMSGLRFSELMEVYQESNQLNAQELYSFLDPDEQLRNVHLDFYHYLNSVFFMQQHSFYAIWEPEGRYAAALRMEPYMDGMLLSALETAPEARRKGYAVALIKSMLDYLNKHTNSKIYSHVSNRNIGSLRVHLKCGFEILKDIAVYSDGSVMRNHYTLIYTNKKSEIA